MASSPISPAPAKSRINYPKRIIICRHGESKGNLSDTAYVNTPDWLIPLTPKGILQSRALAKSIKSIVGSGKLYFYTSPYLRTKQTTFECLQLVRSQTVGVREEPRLTEQQFGNFQDVDEVRRQKEDRIRYGRFYYRFPLGESGLDVFNRVSSFLNTLWRDFEDPDIMGGDEGGCEDEEEMNMVIVCHGLTMRLMLMRFFQYTVADFERSENIDNAGFVIMERRDDRLGSTSTSGSVGDDALSLDSRRKTRTYRLNDHGRRLLRFPRHWGDIDHNERSIDELMVEMRRAGISSFCDPGEHVRYWTRKPIRYDDDDDDDDDDE